MKFPLPKFSSSRTRLEVRRPLRVSCVRCKRLSPRRDPTPLLDCGPRREHRLEQVARSFDAARGGRDGASGRSRRRPKLATEVT